jgi:hypothetical protein
MTPGRKNKIPPTGAGGVQAQALSTSADPPPLPSTASIDRVLRWSAICFVASTVLLCLIAAYAVQTGQVASYLNIAGIIYALLSTLFLGLMGIVFVQGHLGSSREIEAPKLELFEIEEKR